MQADTPTYVALAAILLQLLYLILDYYIYRAPIEDHGLLHYLARKLSTLTPSRHRVAPTTPDILASNENPNEASH